MIKRKLMIGAICLGLVATLFQINQPSHAQETSNSETFLIQNHSVVELGYSTDNEFFSHSFVVKTSNGQYDGNRINYFDFGQTLTLKNNPDKKLTDLKMIYDNMQYNVNYWGSNQIETSMIWDNSSQTYKLPNPWNASDGSVLDTSVSLNSTNNQNGVNVFLTDQSMGVPHVSDITYIGKSSVTNEGTSFVPLSAQLPGLEYDVANLTTGVPIEKTVRVHQEKIGQYGLDGGRWYGIGFNPTMGYTYEYTRTLSTTNPEAQLGIMKGTNANFTSAVSVDNTDGVTYDTVWQVSKDGGVTYTDVPGSENMETYGFPVSGSDNNTLYRMKVTPVGVISQNPALYSEPAQLTVTIPESDLGHVHGKYVDENNKRISEDVDLTGEIGTPYHLDPKTIDGYTLKVMPAEADGNYVAGDKDIIFIYKKNTIVEPTNNPSQPSGLTDKTTQGVSSKRSPSPQTGDTIMLLGLSVLLLGSTTGLILLKRKKAQINK